MKHEKTLELLACEPKYERNPDIEITELDWEKENTNGSYGYSGKIRIRNMAIQFKVYSNQQMYLDDKTHDVTYVCFYGEGYAGYGCGFPITDDRVELPKNVSVRNVANLIVGEFRRCYDKQAHEAGMDLSIEDIS